jgi:hypothetical protein
LITYDEEKSVYKYSARALPPIAVFHEEGETVTALHLFHGMYFVGSSLGNLKALPKVS